MIGIHILAKQRQFTCAGDNKPSGLSHHAINRTGKLRTARVGNNTESTKLVAAFLNTQKCRRSPRRMLNRKAVELYFFGKFRINRTMACGRINLADQFRQPVIGLRANNNIHPWCTADYFLAFSLCNTARNGNRDITPVLVTRAILHHPQAPQFGKYLF